MSEVIVQFENVTKSYPLYHHFTAGLKKLLFNLPTAIREMRTSQFTALENISFEIRRGESVGIIGRNGAGKSTTLGLIAGVLRPSEGRVRVSGRVSPLLELGGGFHPDLTGLENVRLNGVLLGLSRKEVREKIATIVDFAELGQFMDQPVRTYSTGMMARLGFAVVANLNPEILLIDEVLAVGDAAFQKKCTDKMLEFRRAGVTIILVSHSAEDVRKLCNRAIWIDHHRIRMNGSTEDVLKEYGKPIQISSSNEYEA